MNLFFVCLLTINEEELWNIRIPKSIRSPLNKIQCNVSLKTFTGLPLKSKLCSIHWF